MHVYYRFIILHTHHCANATIILNTTRNAAATTTTKPPIINIVTTSDISLGTTIYFRPSETGHANR